MDDVTRQKIDSLVKDNKVVLFMKGTKNFPQCGFSGTVAQILATHKASYKDVNVLADPSIREGIKEYAQWPTIPQLYIDKEFVGGADIMREMYQSGELQKMLETAKA